MTPPVKLEIHILQNFASSNLNRDDTGTPKDCELGGVRRARVSSQCLKRAMRDAFDVHNLVPADQRAARTKRLVENVAAIVAKTGIEIERANRAVALALAGATIKADPDEQWKTQYLLFVPSRLIHELAEIVLTHIDELAPTSIVEEKPEAPPDAPAPDGNEVGTKKAKKVTAKQAKAKAKDAVPSVVVKAVEKILADGTRTPDLALFGRMIADKPEWNVEAACQVAHAVSTHRVSMEFDFYTAIDDLKKNDTAGSDMMGTIPFNSACFYRYLVVDTHAMARNLGGTEADNAQAKETLGALVKAAVLAIPTGKQNSMAAHNLPSLVLVDVRQGAESRSLTNAFVDPVRPKTADSGDLVSQSIESLGIHYAALGKVYGQKGRRDLSFVLVGESEKVRSNFANRTEATDRTSLDDLIKASVDAAFEGAA